MIKHDWRMERRLAWLTSPGGRKFSFGVMGATSCVAFSAQFLPHTYFINKYKEIVSMYQAATPVPLSESVKQRWNEVLADLRVPAYEVKYLEPFTVFGFDVFRAGTVHSRFGAIIGIPINFTYKSSATIDPSPIQVDNEPVNWNRNDAKELLESLILSEDAQRYGIAREVLMVKNNEPIVRSALSAFIVSTMYLLSRGMNNRFELLKQPRGVRLIFYSVAAFFSFGTWALQTDMINCHWEKEADSHIAQLGRNYKLGAVEFYEKMQKRNIALRSLLGSKGEDVYTPKGNEKYIFRQPRIPIDQRKNFFIQSLADTNHDPDNVDNEVVVAEQANGIPA